MVMRFFYSLLAVSTSLIGSAAAQRMAGPSVAAVSVLAPNAKVASAAAPATSSAVAAPTVGFKADSIFVNPDVRPQFAGGEAGLRDYLAKNLHYPDQALRQHVSGKVYVRFILSATGRVTDATVVRGPGSGLSDEALRLVWLMPPWQPARQRGQAVRVSCTLPITFQE
jgi:protein TonB